MFSRLKGAIDSRIAEEQARQRSYQASPSRTNSATARSASRNLSPSKRVAGASAPRGRKDGEPPRRGPDPSEFEPELGVEEEGPPPRYETPRPVKSQEESTLNRDGKGPVLDANSQVEDDKISMGADPLLLQELPTEVRVKLRKLDKLESKYSELLKSYRVAHARILSIEPFEAALRENTPLTSIGDPAAYVEYINQVNLKGDMVVDELKRVTTERDKFKEELSQTKASATKAWDEVSKLRNQSGITAPAQESGRISSEELDKVEVLSANKINNDQLNATAKPPSKSSAASMTSVSMFSPRSKPVETSPIREEKEGFFSYDEELPRIKIEIQERQNVIDGLQIEVKNLQRDLAVARESTQSMVQTLEESSRELVALQERKERADIEYEENQASSGELIDQLRADLRTAEAKFTEIETELRECVPDKVEDLESRLLKTEQELENARSESKRSLDGAEKIEQFTKTIRDLEDDKMNLVNAQEEHKQCEKRTSTLNSLVTSLRLQLTEAEEFKKHTSTKQDTEDVHVHPESQRSGTSVPIHSSDVKATSVPLVGDGASAGKKKNKKKKKSTKPAGLADDDPSIKVGEEHPPKVVDEQDSAQRVVTTLELEINQLRALLAEKENAIERLHGKLKNQEELSEEIETLRDDLVNLGQEHVEGKERVKELVAEKGTLESTIRKLEQEIVDLRSSHDSATNGAEQKQKDLANNFEDLKVKATALQTDLLAAQQLASSRFKDLAEMKGILQRAQPELSALRSEVTGARALREAIGRKEAELERLDSKHEEIRAEGARLGQIVTERDSEIKNLNQKLREEVSSKIRAEDKGHKASQEIHRLETEKRQVTESLDQLSKDLAKSQHDLTSLEVVRRDLEHQLSKINHENEILKEEINLKTAQHASAQSLMSSMRDQTAEMAMQMKEARDRCEGLDEEVAEAHRLLGERSREGETMRRLLADVQGRADARTREMKERMDTAIEERDRAEEEASTAGRRKARELEEVRNRFRETERGLKRAEADKEELENAQRDWRRRRDELEHESARTVQEGDEVRKAMGELRDALDESERQARDLEKQKAEMRRSMEEMQHRLEKLHKSNKVMADEMRSVQSAKAQRLKSEGHSSRSSTEQSRQERLDSPTPKSASGSVALHDGANGQTPTPIDYIYLKNVLLQFLEQKDKKHQMQLIPVLGMLLHFDRKDEQKWISTIVAK